MKPHKVLRGLSAPSPSACNVLSCLDDGAAVHLAARFYAGFDASAARICLSIPVLAGPVMPGRV